MSYNTIIFDFDDTIVSTKHKHIRSFIEAAKKSGLTIKKEEVKKIYGLPTLVMLEKIFPDETKSTLKKISLEKDKAYRKIVHSEGIKLLPGIKSLLEHIRKKGVKTGIMSADKSKNIKLVLRKNGILEYFEEIIGADVVSSHKPNPDGLQKTAKKMKVKSKNCVFVGDSEYDMLAAKRAKMFAVGITTGFYSKKKLQEKGAKLVFNKHSDILNAIKSGKIKLKTNC